MAEYAPVFVFFAALGTTYKSTNIIPCSKGKLGQMSSQFSWEKKISRDPWPDKTGGCYYSSNSNLSF